MLFTNGATSVGPVRVRAESTRLCCSHGGGAEQSGAACSNVLDILTWIQ